MHSRLRETILNRKVPMNFILEVEEMILVMEEELLERPTIENVDDESEDDDDEYEIDMEEEISDQSDEPDEQSEQSDED